MVHSAYECAEIPEASFDLRGESELEPLVDIDLVRHGPGVFDVFVDTSSVRLQSASWSHALKQEPGDIRLVHG